MEARTGPILEGIAKKLEPWRPSSAVRALRQANQPNQSPLMSASWFALYFLSGFERRALSQLPVLMRAISSPFCLMLSSIVWISLHWASTSAITRPWP